MKLSNTSVRCTFLLVAIISSCQKVDLKFDPASPCQSNTICLQLDQSSAEADGATVIKITAYIPSITDEENRIITFSSTTGSFKSEANQQNPEIKADANGKAQTELTVGTTPGLFMVTATVKAGDDSFLVKQMITLTAPGSSALDLQITPDPTAPADGQTVRFLEVKVPASFYNSTNTIKFMAGEAGVFDAPSDPSKPNETEVLIGPNLYAIAKMKVGTKHGVHTIRAQLTSNPIFKDQKDLTLLPVATNDVITFNFGIDPSSLRANDRTTIPVEVTVQGIDINNKKIKLEAIGGWSFEDQNANTVELPLSGQGTASVILRVGRSPVACLFRATIDNFIKSEHVTLKNANPKFLTLIPSPDSIKAQGGSVMIEGYLRRMITDGKVSIGTPIYFEAFQDTTELFGFVPPEVTSNENELVKIEFRTPSASTINTTQRIMIKAKAYDDDDVLIDDVIFLHVFD